MKELKHVGERIMVGRVASGELVRTCCMLALCMDALILSVFIVVHKLTLQTGQNHLAGAHK